MHVLSRQLLVPDLYLLVHQIEIILKQIEKLLDNIALVDIEYQCHPKPHLIDGHHRWI